jgi:hypothetical protein
MRKLRWISGIMWIFTWYTVYLEIFRWRHMTKSLRFNPPPTPPGTNIQPKPGMPIITVRVGSLMAPLVFLTAAIVERVRESTADELTRRKQRVGRDGETAFRCGRGGRRERKSVHTDSTTPVGVSAL